ncbi:hypothetical protein JB92DRAFT_2887114 [Gautieria morchelliformis]|nr:hypothetical protein JB92DRAFT_2887114 [Gautieria morchelliformis]
MRHLATQMLLLLPIQPPWSLQISRGKPRTRPIPNRAVMAHWNIDGELDTRPPTTAKTRRHAKDPGASSLPAPAPSLPTHPHRWDHHGLPPITALLGDSDTQNTLLCTHRDGCFGTAEVCGPRPLTWSGSLSSGPCLDPLIQAAILGSPSRRLRLADIQEAIERWTLNDLFARQLWGRNENQWQRRRAYWFVVAEPPVQVVPRPPLPPAHVPLPNFGDFVKAESWNPEEVPPFHPSEDVPPQDAWAGPSNPRYL